MIHTLIEVTAESEWEHGSQLRQTLDKLGYEPKRDEEFGRFFSDLRHALLDLKLDANKLVDDYRMKLAKESLEARQPEVA